MADPPLVDFGVQPVCGASRRSFDLRLEAGEIGDKVSAVKVTGVSIPSSEFYSLSFTPSVLTGGQRLTLHVVSIVRSLGNIATNLTVQTDSGDVYIPLHAIGVANPFNVGPIIEKIPVGRLYTHPLSLSNPRPGEALQLLDSSALEAPWLKLEVPGSSYNATIPGKHHVSRLSSLALDWIPAPSPPPGAQPASAAGQPRPAPSPIPPAWTVPGGTSAEVARLSFKPDAPGVYEGHVHLHMSAGDLIVPVVLTAVTGGLVHHPSAIDLG